jgi:hypothetical protein
VPSLLDYADAGEPSLDQALRLDVLNPLRLFPATHQRRLNVGPTGRRGTRETKSFIATASEEIKVQRASPTRSSSQSGRAERCRLKAIRHPPCN